MNCNILFFVRTFNHSFKHLICPISKHILRQDCPVVNVSLATVLFHNGKGNLFFLTLVRMTGLVVSKANVIAKRANLFATVKRLRKTNCACRTTVLCTDTTCFICLLCPLRSMSANALRLRLSLLAGSCMAGFATQCVVATKLQKSRDAKKITALLLFLWCVLRDSNPGPTD